MVNPLVSDKWKSMVLRAVDDDGTVLAVFDDLWARFASLDVADPTGELRYKTAVLAALDMRLPVIAKNVNTSEGGQSGSWGQYYDHMKDLRTTLKEELAAYSKTLGAWGLVVDTLEAYSLTPVAYPGYQPDPAHPGYMGDPRYRRGWIP